MRELERVVLLKNVDTKWMDHIDAMEELKRGIRLRAYAQRDPVVEYRLKGFDMFDEMIASIREDTARMMLTLRLQVRKPLPENRWPILTLPTQALPSLRAPAVPAISPRLPYRLRPRPGISPPSGNRWQSPPLPAAAPTVLIPPTKLSAKGKKVGRNDPCPCGSGKSIRNAAAETNKAHKKRPQIIGAAFLRASALAPMFFFILPNHSRR